MKCTKTIAHFLTLLAVFQAQEHSTIIWSFVRFF